MTYIPGFNSTNTMQVNFMQFGAMVSCNAGGLLNVYADYNGYGCYCGLGGTGTPVDATDRCCKSHDECYDRALASTNCWRVTGDTYLLSYQYTRTCSGGLPSIRCKAASDYTWWERALVDFKQQCAAAVCRCDAAAASCFAWNRSSYSTRYRNYNRARCSSIWT